MTVRQEHRTADPAMERERVEFVLSHLNRLAPLPAVAARLLALTTSVERTHPASAGEVVEMIESDTVLTAAVLRLVRRADPGASGEAMTVKRAVTLMGFGAVKNAVLSIQLFEALSDPADEQRLTSIRKELWRHNLAVACAAELIGEELGASGVNGEAFVCGLLHDIGKLALIRCLPKTYARVLDRVDRQGMCVCDAEREIVGLDHTIAGKHLAQRWSLSQPIVECVWLHHQSPDALPATVVAKPLVRIVHLADSLVRRERIGYSGYRDVGAFEKLAAAAGLDAARLERVRDRLPEQIARYCEFMAFDESQGRREASASLYASNRQLSQRNEELVRRHHQLEVRSACLSALAAFTRSVGEHDRLSDVCVAAAQSLRIPLGAEQAVVLAYDPASRCIHVGVCDASGRTNASVVHPVDDDDGDMWERELGVAPVSDPCLAPDGNGCHGGLARATHDLEVIWQRCTGSQPPAPIWTLPLTVRDERTGVALLAAPQESVASFSSSKGACEVLSGAVGMALSCVGARIEAERMSEELLDLNRRLRTAQEQLVQTRSISLIAAMAAGTAHELNDPLSVISGRAQMKLDDCEDPETARVLQIIIDETARATGIVTAMMNFAKPPAPQPRLQSLHGVLETLCQHWCSTWPLEPASIQVCLADPEQTVYADPAQLFEILDSLVVNAVEAGRGKTARVQINSPSRPSDEKVRIVVRDDGVGMTREVLEHAIDPFFSNRPAGRGRGLGLSRAFRLAEVNGGRLWLESEPQRGTTVTIELPARA